jgi:O-methyltransferase
VSGSVIEAFDVLVEANPRMGGPAKFAALYWGLSQTLGYGVLGDIVELGCNKGHTSVFFQVINETESRPPRELHLYDSFAGLPALTSVDGAAFSQGDLRASANEVVERFVHRGLTMPIVHSGWFDHTLKSELPPAVCFAYIDADLFESTVIGLKALYQRLSPGALVMIDDYCDPSLNPRAWDLLPGVKEACDTALDGTPEIVRVVPGDGDLALAYFRKL